MSTTLKIIIAFIYSEVETTAFVFLLYFQLPQKYICLKYIKQIVQLWIQDIVNQAEQ